MCNPIAFAAIAIAASTTVTAVSANQSTQHAKGAAEAQQKAMNDAAIKQGAIGAPQTTTNPSTSSATVAAQADARRQAALRAGLLSTIGTTPGTGGSGATGVTPTVAAAVGAGKNTLG